MNDDLREYFRIQLLRIFKSAHLMGFRLEAVCQHIRVNPEFRAVTEEEVRAELELLLSNGWIEAAPIALKPGAFLYRLTRLGAEFCLEQGIQ